MDQRLPTSEKTDIGLQPPSVAARLLHDPKVVCAGGFILLLIVVALAAPLIAPKDPLEQNLLLATVPPQTEPGYLLGTDDLGRDVLSRMIFGSRIALTVAFSAAGLSCLIGSLLGLLAGYLRGFADAVISRLVDIWMAFPPVLLSILLVAILGTLKAGAIFAEIMPQAGEIAPSVRTEAGSKTFAQFRYGAQVICQ